MSTRRSFLRRLAASSLLGTAASIPLIQALSRAAIAVPPALPGKRFVFVVNRGGWDPLSGLAPLFGKAQIAMPIGAEPATEGGLPVVASAQTPSVGAFFRAYGSRCVVLHGLAVRSVSHEVCELTMMTGHATGDTPDHATRLATVDEQVALPHLVLGGPAYPGALSAIVARAGETGQLQELVTGDLLGRSDQTTRGLSAPAERLVNDFVRRRAQAAADSAPTPKRRALADSLARAERLHDLRWDVSYASSGSLGSQLDVAHQVLARGLCECVTVSPPVSWDTHTDSDNQQGPLWEALFASLTGFVRRLNDTPTPGGLVGRSLADDTVIVVLSEMGRTPQLNTDQGRDHWPYTSALLIGDGLTGGRVVGGYDDGYSGIGLDPASAEPDPARPPPSPAQLGATLLALAGLDPAVLGPGVVPLRGILA